MSIRALTTNYGFRLIDYATDPYHEDEWFNWKLLDGVVSAVQSLVPFAVAAGTANVITAAYTPAQTLVAGLVVSFKALAANTGACTLNTDGTGAKPVKINGADPAAGAIPAGMYVKVIYDGTNWNVIYPSFSVTQGAKVSTAASGATADVNADDFVVENSGAVGMTLLCPNGSIARYYMGDVAKPDAGGLVYDFAVDKLYARAAQANGAYMDVGGVWRQPTLPVFYAYKEVTVAAAFPAANTTLIFGTELIDQGANYDNTTGIFTAPQAGLYEFTFKGDLTGSYNVATVYKIAFMVNGVQQGPTYISNSQSNYYSPNVGDWTIILSLAKNDTVKINLLTGSTGNVSPATGTYILSFMGKMLP